MPNVMIGRAEPDPERVAALHVVSGRHGGGVLLRWDGRVTGLLVLLMTLALLGVAHAVVLSRMLAADHGGPPDRRRVM